MRPEHLLNYGFTPTCQAALERLAGLLSPSNCGGKPEASAVIRLFDPCAGEGEALAYLARALFQQGAQAVESYGVEIEEGRAAKAAAILDHVIRADFRRTATTHKSMSLIFLNPPYDNAGGEDSLEKTIIRRALPYLAEDGVAVLVIPARLLEWAEEKLKMRWLALYPSEDPNSLNQVVLVGKPAKESQPLPELGAVQPVVVSAADRVGAAQSLPADGGKPVTFRVTYVTPEDLQTALLTTPMPDLYPVSGEAEQAVIHPLRAGHRAAYLAGHSGTIALPDGRYLRVAIQRVETKREEEDEDGKVRKSVLSFPKMTAYILSPRSSGVNGDLNEIPFEQITDLAGDIDQAISLKSHVEERPDGMPEVAAWEQAVLEQINARLPVLNGRQGLLPPQAVRAVGMARALRAAPTRCTGRPSAAPTRQGGQKAVFGVMEMGYGKTPIALTIRSLIAARTKHLGGIGLGLTVVLCPPHLVRKWGREAKRLAPDAKIVTPEGDGAARQAQVHAAIDASARGQDVILILSREAMKLGPLHRVGVVPKVYPAIGKRKVWACPCGAPAVTKAEEGWGAEEIIRFGEWIQALPGQEPPRRLMGKKCPACGVPYATSEAKPRRWPLSEAIYRAAKSGRVRNLFLIADEVHEYRNASLQGTAFSRLFRVAKWAVLLTGTLFGGKASDLYRLLRWTSPELRRMGLGEKEFVEQYGYAESVEIVDEKRSYGRRVTRSEFRERAGVSPAIYRFLLGRTAFGALRDVAAALPGYKEERVEIAPPDLGVDHIFTHSYGGRLYHEQGKGALSAWLRAALGYYNIAAVQPEEDAHLYRFVHRDEDGYAEEEKIVLRLPIVPDSSILPKEERLLKLLLEERKEGRKAVILLEQTTTRPLPARLAALLKKAGLRAVYLDTGKVPASEREEWIEKHAHEMDALITHPKAVETGLDLVMFQTVIAYEAIYAVISLAQAICRVWRLGQTRPVRVFSFGHSGLELDAWDVIAAKIAWAKSVYGDFMPSALGEAGADANLNLLRALTEKIVSGKDLRQRTSVAATIPLLSTLAGIDLTEILPAEPIPAPDIFQPMPAPAYVDWQAWARERGVSTARRQRSVQQPAESAQLSLL